MHYIFRSVQLGLFVLVESIGSRRRERHKHSPSLMNAQPFNNKQLIVCDHFFLFCCEYDKRKMVANSFFFVCLSCMPESNDFLFRKQKKLLQFISQQECQFNAHQTRALRVFSFARRTKKAAKATKKSNSVLPNRSASRTSAH